MAIMPKPELEQGNFIAYTDEPNTVVSGSGGGGGTVYLNMAYDADSTPSYIPEFSYNDVKNNVEAGKIVCIRSIYTDAGSDTIEIHQVINVVKSSDPVEYAVTTEKPTFSANVPDAPMTFDSL